MSRKPSLETEVKSLRREIKRLKGNERLWQTYRARATQAEQKCAEWEKRFDQLLFNASKVALELHSKTGDDHGT